MKKGLIKTFQIIIVLIGISTLVLMLWEPHLEGRNVNATVFEIYFHDPFLVYAYASSIAFFVALYQMIKVLGYAGQNNLVSPASIKSLRTIKYCAVSLIILVVGAEAYIFATMRGKDDIAGGMALGHFIILVCFAMGTASAIFERKLQKSIKV